MKILGLGGWSGAGKTTLMAKLIPELVGRGVTVSTMKHAHHGFDVDQPGKDSWRHRMAGCTEVLVSSARRYAVMHELRDEEELSLAQAVARLAPCSLVLVEGYKTHPIPKLEIWRPAVGKPVLHGDDPHIVAVATDVHGALPDCPLPVFALSAVDEIATFVLHNAADWPVAD